MSGSMIAGLIVMLALAFGVVDGAVAVPEGTITLVVPNFRTPDMRT